MLFEYSTVTLTVRINLSFSSRQVYIDSLYCGTINYKDGVNPYVLDCGVHKAREVTVVGVNVLTLCEVEVFSSYPPGLRCYVHPRNLNVLFERNLNFTT